MSLRNPDENPNVDPGSGGGGGGGGGTGSGATSAGALENVQAALGIPLTLSYGYASVRGNEVYRAKQADGTRYPWILFGEGQWDGIDRGWVNSALINPADTTICHFHPGKDGEVGSGSTGGDQKLDAFWSVMPASINRVTFSRMANVVLKVAPDPSAPNADLTWLFHMRTMVLRDFDNAGTMTGYAFSTNPVREYLDLVIRRQLKPDFAVGEDLTVDEKTKIDWPCFCDSRDYCNEVLANGAKRFEASLAWPSRVRLAEAKAQLAMCFRGYERQSGGKLQIRVDQARAVSFSMSGAHVQPDTVQIDERDVDGLPNRLVGVYRELNPRAISTIATISRTAGVVTIVTAATHPFLVGDNVEVFNVGADALDGDMIVATVPDGTHLTAVQAGADSGTYHVGSVGTPESRFSQATCIFNHEAHQDAMGQRGVGLASMPAEFSQSYDFGANTFERVSRLLQYMAVRQLGRNVTPYHAPKQLQVTAFAAATDGLGQRADRA
jgi:hypothetical protein